MKATILRTCLIIGIIFIVLKIYGQNDLAIGQWQQFLPFKTSQYVTGGGGDVYYSTGTAIAIVHDDMSVEYLTKIDGLSGVNIRAIHYNTVLAVLVIGYSDGNIDLVYEDGIVNKNEILLNPQIQASRSIKSIYTDSEGIMFLSTDFGLVRMDIDNSEFETVFTSAPASQVVEYEGFLYAALDNGIYRVQRDVNINFIDFNLWEYVGDDFGMPNNYIAQGIVVFDGKLYAGVNGDLYEMSGEPQLIHEEESIDVNLSYLYAGANNLFAGFQCIDDDGKECEGKTIGLDRSGAVKTASSRCSGRPRYVYEDAEGMIWFADDFEILARTTDLYIDCNSENLNTPRSDNVQNVKVIDNVLYVTAGGSDANRTPLNIKTGTSVFKDGAWIEYGYFSELTPTLRADNSQDHIDIIPHPENGKIYIATASKGVVEYNPDNFSFLTYDESNSPLRRVISDGDRPRVFGINFDSEQNLWATNFNVTNPLHVLKPDGTWQSFQPSQFDRLTYLVVDQADNKWIVAEDQGVGLVVFNEGEFNTSGDDQVRNITSNNSELNATDVRSIAIDRDGAIWVGTQQGVIVFNCGDPFSADCTGSKPKVLGDDGFLALLLENETINTIAVDPANRKWFGTNNGIFVQSSSGDEEIFRFTEDNSPLFTSRVIEIEVDPVTGIVYIGTEKGLMAYKSDAIEGQDVHSSSIRTYPNPVEPGYNGAIAIVGLANESSVKIANIHGQLVYETEALGGQAIWDGRDFSGRRVSSGVYYVFGASNSFLGEASGALTKILFLH